MAQSFWQRRQLVIHFQGLQLGQHIDGSNLFFNSTSGTESMSKEGIQSCTSAATASAWRLRATWSRALLIRFLDADGDLALEEQLHAVGVFEDVGLNIKKYFENQNRFNITPFFKLTIN